MQNPLSATSLYQTITALKKQSPLVHNITNFVVMQTTANMLLAIGAAPIMAHAKEELDAIVSIANALVLNIGTLDAYWLASIEQAQKIALQRNIPIILDPVGAGASAFRTNNAKAILERGVTVVRGNASEILSLQNQQQNTKGVDSSHESKAALQAAITLSQQYHCCVVISGQQDIVCFNQMIFCLEHGTPLLTRVTGMGCSATALIGAFAAVIKDSAYASIYAMAVLGLAAEKAEKSAQGPGTFYPALLDVLSTLELADCAPFHCERMQ